MSETTIPEGWVRTSVMKPGDNYVQFHVPGVKGPLVGRRESSDQAGPRPWEDRLSADVVGDCDTYSDDQVLCWRELAMEPFEEKQQPVTRKPFELEHHEGAVTRIEPDPVTGLEWAIVSVLGHEVARMRQYPGQTTEGDKVALRFTLS